MSHIKQIKANFVKIIQDVYNENQVPIPKKIAAQYFSKDFTLLDTILCKDLHLLYMKNQIVKILSAPFQNVTTHINWNKWYQFLEKYIPAAKPFLIRPRSAIHLYHKLQIQFNHCLSSDILELYKFFIDHDDDDIFIEMIKIIKDNHDKDQTFINTKLFEYMMDNDDQFHDYCMIDCHKIEQVTKDEHKKSQQYMMEKWYNLNFWKYDLYFKYMNVLTDIIHIFEYNINRCDFCGISKLLHEHVIEGGIYTCANGNEEILSILLDMNKNPMDYVLFNSDKFRSIPIYPSFENMPNTEILSHKFDIDPQTQIFRVNDAYLQLRLLAMKFFGLFNPRNENLSSTDGILHEKWNHSHVALSSTIRHFLIATHIQSSIDANGRNLELLAPIAIPGKEMSQAIIGSPNKNHWHKSISHDIKLPTLRPHDIHRLSMLTSCVTSISTRMEIIERFFNSFYNTPRESGYLSIWLWNNRLLKKYYYEIVPNTKFVNRDKLISVVRYIQFTRSKLIDVNIRNQCMIDMHIENRKKLKTYMIGIRKKMKPYMIPAEDIESINDDLRVEREYLQESNIDKLLLKLHCINSSKTDIYKCYKLCDVPYTKKIQSDLKYKMATYDNNRNYSRRRGRGRRGRSYNNGRSRGRGRNESKRKRGKRKPGPDGFTTIK